MRSQSLVLLGLDWECAHLAAQTFCHSGKLARHHRGATGIDLGVTNKMQEAGKLANTESANHKDWLNLIRNSNSLISQMKINFLPKGSWIFLGGRLFLSCPVCSLKPVPVIFSICLAHHAHFYPLRYDEERSYKRSVR